MMISTGVMDGETTVRPCFDFYIMWAMTTQGLSPLPDAGRHFRLLERMYHGAPINAYFAPTLRIVEPGVTELRTTVRPDLHHAARAAHGAVYFKALDDATFFAVSSLVEDVFVLTVSFNLYLLRPVASGEIVARGRVLNRSRRLWVAEGVLTDDRGREIARGSGNFVRSETALTPEIGYA